MALPARSSFSARPRSQALIVGLFHLALPIAADTTIAAATTVLPVYATTEAPSVIGALTGFLGQVSTTMPATTPAVPVATETLGCYKYGVIYDDDDWIEGNHSFVEQDTKACQDKCEATTDCQHWSFWMAGPYEYRCDLSVAGAYLRAPADPALAPVCVSGPKTCPEPELNSAATVGLPSTSACTELPGRGFPGEYPNKSQAAWPSGEVPVMGQCWPHDILGYPIRCPTQTLTVMEDVADGWPGACLGLIRQMPPPGVTCQEMCEDNILCSVWQELNYTDPPQCWHGETGPMNKEGLDCYNRPGFNSSRGQRIMHGSYRVLKDVAGTQIMGLTQMFSPKAFKDQNVGAARCRLYCMAQLTCSWWTYSFKFGCYIEDVSRDRVTYPLTNQSEFMRTDSEHATTIIAGEFIQHVCGGTNAPAVSEALALAFPPTPPPTPPIALVDGPTLAPELTTPVAAAITAGPTAPPTEMPTYPEATPTPTLPVEAAGSYEEVPDDCSTMRLGTCALSSRPNMCSINGQHYCCERECGEAGCYVDTKATCNAAECHPSRGDTDCTGGFMDKTCKCKPGSCVLDGKCVIEQELGLTRSSGMSMGSAPDLLSGTPAPTPAPVITTMSEPVEAGATTIDVASTAGINVGDIITVGDETNTVAGIGSLLLSTPLQRAHPAGTTITASAPVASTTAAAGTTAAQMATVAATTTTEAASEETSSLWMHVLIGVLVLAGVAALAMGGFFAFTKMGSGKKDKRTSQPGKRSAKLDKVAEENPVAEESQQLLQAPSYQPKEVYVPPPVVDAQYAQYAQTQPSLQPPAPLTVPQGMVYEPPQAVSFTPVPQYQQTQAYLPQQQPYSAYPNYQQPQALLPQASYQPQQYQPQAPVMMQTQSALPTQPYFQN